MTRMQIPLRDYLEAVRNAEDPGYLHHLVHDFVVDDGFAMPKLDFINNKKDGLVLSDLN